MFHRKTSVIVFNVEKQNAKQNVIPRCPKLINDNELKKLKDANNNNKDILLIELIDDDEEKDNCRRNEASEEERMKITRKNSGNIDNDKDNGEDNDSFVEIIAEVDRRSIGAEAQKQPSNLQENKEKRIDIPILSSKTSTLKTQLEPCKLNFLPISPIIPPTQAESPNESQQEPGEKTREYNEQNELRLNKEGTAYVCVFNGCFSTATTKDKMRSHYYYIHKQQPWKKCFQVNCD